MGADIHMHLEYRVPNSAYWSGFGGRINPGRDYALFGLIAGVRGDGQIFPLKGLPDDLSWDADTYYWTRVDDERAAKYPDNYYSTEQVRQWRADTRETHGRTYALNPDLHSITWLTPGEMTSVMAAYHSENGPTLGSEYGALHAAAMYLQDQGYSVRYIISFDN